MTDRVRSVVPLLAAILIVFWTVMLWSSYGRGFAIDRHGTPVASDYVGVYTAGQLAVSGHPEAAYDQATHEAAQKSLLGGNATSFFPWPYPPTFLVIAAALSLLPFAPSMLLWIIATNAAFAFAVARIAPSWRECLILLALPAVWLNAYVGQNGALSTALIGLGLFALPTRPIVAGVFIGLLSFKPHLGLLFPIALIAGGHFRTAIAATVTVLGLALAAALIFGLTPWLAMPAQLQAISAIIGDNWRFDKIQSVYGLGRASGLSAQTAFTAQMALLVLLAAFTAWLWRQSAISYDLKAAALAAATTMMSPYQFVYDLTILTIAQAFLLRYLVTRPIHVGEIGALVAANALIFGFNKFGLPLGAVGAAIVMALIAYRAVVDRQTGSQTLGRVSQPV